MRIVAGKHKGKRFQAPKNLPVRPTTDRCKEALFNILNNQYYFEGLNVLDLFAGTGNMSYEFASRGVKSISCVEQHAGCVKFINQTSESLLAPIATIKKDVFIFLKSATIKADLIFADPPYDFSLKQLQLLVNLVFEKELLVEDGLLIIEHHKHVDLSQTINFAYSRKYGDTVFSFFEL